MAKLRIIDKTHLVNNQHELSENGYVNLTTSLQDETNFSTFSTKGDVTMLQNLIGENGVDIHLVQAKAVLNGDVYQVIDEEADIDNQKCKLKVNTDEYYLDKGQSKFSISLPPYSKKTGGSLPTDLSYLDPYIQQIIKLYLNKVSGTNYYEDSKSKADKDRAYKFMFGAMLLTRCR